MAYILSYDLGTGGTKASLYDEAGRSWPAPLFPATPSIRASSGMNSARTTGGVRWWKARSRY